MVTCSKEDSARCAITDKYRHTQAVILDAKNPFAPNRLIIQLLLPLCANTQIITSCCTVTSLYNLRKGRRRDSIECKYSNDTEYRIIVCQSNYTPRKNYPIEPSRALDLPISRSKVMSLTDRIPPKIDDGVVESSKSKFPWKY